MLVLVLAGRASVRTLESNTTVRFSLNASQLPARFSFAMPSPVNFSSAASTAQVRATLPSGNLTQLNLTAAAAGVNLSALKGAAPIATQSVWLNASGNITTSGFINGTQDLAVVVPANGLPPMEVRATKITQWAGPGNFAGARFFVLQNAPGDGGGTMRVTLWTRGSPESGLYLNTSVSPANVARAADISVAGAVGGRTLNASTNWSVNQNAVLAPNHDFENCTNLLRLQNGSWRLFCTFVDTDVNMTVTHGVDSAYSPDGVSWSWEPGVRYQLCAGAHDIDNIALLRLLDGTLRMWYTGQSATNCGGGGQQFRFATAVSSDEGSTWTFEFASTNNNGGPVSTTFAASAQGWVRWYLYFGTGFFWSFLYDGSLPASGNFTFDGPNVTADNPRNVYLLTDGTYKMYFGTTAVYSATSPNGVNWSSPQLEVANWSGDIESGPLLDKGDGSLTMLLYSQTSGLFLATLGAVSATAPAVTVNASRSDGQLFGAALLSPNSAGAFSVNATVPSTAPLGRFRVAASAWFGGVSPAGLVLNRAPMWTGPPAIAAVEDVNLTFNISASVQDGDDGDLVVINASSAYGTFDGAAITLLYADGVLSDTVVVFLSDGLDNETVLLSVTVAPVDDPPWIALNGSYNVVEDTPTAIDFQGRYADEETPAGLLTLFTNASGATVSGSLITFNITDEQNVNVTIGVSDGSNATSAATTLRVLRVDDPPILTLNATYYGREDALVTLDFAPAIWDDDTPLGSLLLATDLPDANVSGLSLTVWYTVPGVIPFNITVFDGTTPVRGASLLVVQQANDAPTINLSSSYVGLEDSPIVIDLTSAVADEDSPPSSLYLVTDLPGADINGLTISITVYKPDSIVFHVTVFDGSANMTSTSMLIVQAVNDPPQWLSAPAITAVEETALTINLSAYVFDEDNASDELVFTADSPFATVSGALVTFEYPEGVLADTLNLTVSDGLSTVSLAVAVSVAPTNDPPVLVGEPPFEIAAGSVVAFAFSGSDAETPQSLRFLLESSAPWISLSPSGLLTFAPPNATHGRFPYNVTVTDGAGGSATRSFVVKIGNLAPVIMDIALDARPNVLYSTVVVVVDPDGDPVSVLMFPEDPTMLFNNTTGEILWVPSYGRLPGVRIDDLANLTIRATDGIAISSRTFSIRVRDPPNEAPFFDGNLPALLGHVNEVVTLNLFDYVTDPDDPDANLTWRVDGGLDGGVALWKLDPIRGSLRIEFKGEGEGNLTVSVRDRSGVGGNQTLRVVTQPGREAEGPATVPFPWWLLVLVIASAMATAGYTARRARPRAAALAPPHDRAAYMVENVILLSRDGRPLFTQGDSRPDSPKDSDVLGSMIIAVQDFVRDALAEGGALSRMSYGDSAILFERGEHVILAVTVFGEPGEALEDLMAETVGRVERMFAGVIEHWDGDREALAGLEDVLAPLWLGTAKLTRADVLAATRGAQVEMRSAVEFFQGYVRVRVAVVNNTTAVINGAVLDIDFNEDVLRLVRIDPPGYKSAGARVVVGSVAPGERLGLSYYLDPQICTTSAIAGSCVYRDLSGRQHVVEMKSRKAEVVCPIFFTKEQANSALLKRLIETELNVYDARSYRLKAGIADADLEQVFATMKSAVLAHDVQLVRSHERRRPYSGESWFYGRTQVKGLQMVIRAAVNPTKSRAEFFVASTVMAPVTGLLAELHHTFMAEAAAKFAGLGLQPLFDEGLKAQYTNRTAVSRMVESEAEPGEAESHE